MSQVINLSSGISTFGNATADDVLISNLETMGIDSIKTLDGGIWTSWTKDAPEAFQGFTSIKKGMGYVANCNAVSSLTFNGADIDVNNVPYSTGLSMLCLPFDGRLIGTGYVPRVKLGSIKTINGSWKSWVKGAPDGLQGFLTIDKNKGYVTVIEEIFGSYLNNNVQNKSEGIRFNTSDTNMVNGEVTNGVRYTDPNNVGSLSFDAVSFDETVPTVIMFVKVNGLIAKIEFPQELAGSAFFIPNGGTTYTGVFAENEDYANPTNIVDTVDGSSLEISYDPVAVDLAKTTFTEMTVSYDGLESVLEFASEYEGNTFTIWKDGKIGTGIFGAGTVTVTLA